MNDLQAQAVASVQGRGFYGPDAIPTNAKNPLLMAQFLRLVEEVGELGRALRKDVGTAEEAADVLVVLYQISHICGIALEEATRTKILADEQRGHLHNGFEAGRSRVRLVEADGLIGGIIYGSQNATAQDVVDRHPEGWGTDTF